MSDDFDYDALLERDPIPPTPASEPGYVEALENAFVTNETFYSALARSFPGLNIACTEKDEVHAKGALAGLRRAFANASSCACGTSTVGTYRDGGKHRADVCGWGEAAHNAPRCLSCGGVTGHLYADCTPSGSAHEVPSA